MKRLTIGGLVGVVVSLSALVPLASGHATVSLLQPQGKVLTSARAAFVLRAPNERAAQNTFQVTLYVPEPLQRGISVKQVADWAVVLKRRDTGEKNAEGSPIFAIERITWIAKKGNQVAPGFYAEFALRWQNPTTPQRLCFAIDQWYTKKEGTTKPERVQWNGPPESQTPASCLDVVAS